MRVCDHCDRFPANFLAQKMDFTQHKDVQILNVTHTYTDEIGQKICARIAQGETIFGICKHDTNYPPCSTVYSWLDNNPEFQKIYKIAEQSQLKALAEQILYYSTPEFVQTTLKDGQGGERSHSAQVQAHALACEWRKWWLGKKLVKQWGDQQSIELKLDDNADSDSQIKQIIASVASGELLLNDAEKLANLIYKRTECFDVTKLSEQISQLKLAIESKHRE